ncbi:MAG: hypothetical protein AVDCRST_MAG66-2800, partial [uncultured Pseudonocardia sp.]
AVPCRRVPARDRRDRRRLVPDLYRASVRTGARVASRRPGIARPRGGPGAALDAHRRMPREALPPGRRVV